MKKFVCKGKNGEGCPKNHSTDDPSNLKKHLKICGLGPGSGGARAAEVNQNAEDLYERAHAAFSKWRQRPYESTIKDKQLFEVSKTSCEQILASHQSRKCYLSAEARALLTILLGTDLTLLAHVSFEIGHTDAAVTHLENALDIFKEGAIEQDHFETQDNQFNHEWIEHNIAHTRHKLGVVLHKQGKREEAARHFEHALQHYKSECPIGAPCCAKQNQGGERDKGCFIANIYCYTRGQSAANHREQICHRETFNRCIGCNPFDGCCYIGGDANEETAIGCVLCKK
jgi:tetratricopeptide (TPR) repeat protein